MMQINPMPLFYEISTWALPVVISVVFHEVAHGYTAYLLGDKTAYSQKRLTLNPLAHIDLAGSVALPLLLILLKAPILFGWAKPVPVNFSRLAHPRRDSFLVALAGPAMNFLLAVLSVFVMKLVLQYMQPDVMLTSWLLENAKNCLLFSLVIGIFNLMPILPLDGGRMLNALLPNVLARKYQMTERYGFYVLVAVLFILPLVFKIDIFAWAMNIMFPKAIALVYHIAGIF